MANRRGRPSTEFTEDTRNAVRMMSAAGITEDRISKALVIDPKTLRAHFREELDSARDQMTGLAMGQLARAIQRGEAWAICFWMKCRAGWQEKQQVEVTGAISLVEILRRREAKQLTAVKEEKE